MKMFGFAAHSQTMEGFMKTFDTKFQIPKLSARSASSDDTKKDPLAITSPLQVTPIPNLLSTTATPAAGQNPLSAGGNDDATKLLMDFFSSKDKYSYGLGKFPSDSNALNSQYINSLANMAARSTASPKYSDVHFNSDLQIYKSSSSDSISTTSAKEFRDKHFSLSNPTTPTCTVAPAFPSPIPFTHPSMEKSPSHPSPSESPKMNHHTSTIINQTMRPPSAPPISAHLSSSSTLSQDSHKSSESALDFSNPSQAKSDSQPHKLLEHRNSIQAMPIRKGTPSPSVQVHIVKSPVPSPMVNPSPHSNSSPCITDDELMDEALVGIGGK